MRKKKIIGHKKNPRTKDELSYSDLFSEKDGKKRFRGCEYTNTRR